MYSVAILARNHLIQSSQISRNKKHNYTAAQHQTIYGTKTDP